MATGGGKGGAGKVRVNEYYLSIHYGVCHGPVIFKSIKYKDKVIWQGSQSTPGYADVHLPDLMGGPTQEGGVSGRIYFLPGNATQVAPAALAAKLGLTPETCPAFRGVASLFFTGGAFQMFDNRSYLIDAADGLSPQMHAYYNGLNSQPGFYWTANNPFLEGVKVEAECVFTQLGETHAVIGEGLHNPAHLIWAALVDQNWGMGAPAYLLGQQSFLDAAELFYSETFGIALKWNQQDSIESFIGEILDHVQATVFVNPTTGLLDIKPLRADYDVNSLPEINAGNAKLLRFERKLFGEVSNEVIVSWTNPATEQSETLTAQDLANIEIQGGPVSANRDYYAVRAAELAQRLLDRDLRTVSAPLASLEVEMDRRGRALVPGSVVRANFPKRKIDAICRVTSINYGKAKDSKIKVSLMEDIFALDLPAPTTPPGSAWGNVQEQPAPIDHSQIFTVPSFFTNGLVGSGAELVYPEVIAGVLAYKDGVDAIGYEMLTERADVAGTMRWFNEGGKSLLGRAQLLTPLYQEAQSLIGGIPNATTLRNPRIGSFIIIGTGSDASMEWGLITGFDDDNLSWIVSRGILDTVPRSWPVGTPVWFMPGDANVADTRDYKSASETVEFKLLTRTSLGLLPFEDADTLSGTMTARPHAPLRPANVKINGQGFGTINATGATELVVSWSNRNRELEDGQIVAWDAGSITPEYLQETVITVFRENGDLMYYRKGLWTETTFTIPIAWVQQEEKIFIRVSSQRSGIASIQSYGMWVENIPQVGSPSAPPPSDDGPAPPPPPADEEDPEPDPVEGIEDPPLPDLGGGPGEWS
jgi:hypothetical protein